MDSPLAEQQQKFTNSPPEEEAVLQEWCSQGHVSLPTDTLNVSDGSIKPLSPQEEKELRDHINSGHVKKSNLRAFYQRGPGSSTEGSEMSIEQHMCCILILQGLT